MLKFIKATEIDLIPKRLVNQIEERKYSVEEFYAFKRLSNSTSIDLIINLKNDIIGFIDYNVDELNKEIYINCLSIDKEYKCDYKTLPFVIDCFKLLSKKLNFAVIWHCYRPEYFLRHGFNKVKGALLQYTCD